MKKILHLYVLLFCFQLQAQDFWTETTPFPNHPDYYVKSISIVDANTVWVLGISNNSNNMTYEQYAVSTDGGITWTDGVINLGSSIVTASNIHAISATKAYVSVYPELPTHQGGVWITQDSGATWTKQQSALYNTGTDSKADFLHFFDASNGVVVGDPAGGYFEIYTTSNAGTNWIRVPSSNIPAPLEGEIIYDARYYDAVLDAVWFGTNKGNIYRSFDKGYHWDKTQSPYSNFGNDPYYAHFAFRNPYDGIMVGSDWETYRTGNGGASWNAEMWANPFLRNFNVVYVPQTANTYFCWGWDAIDNLNGFSYSNNGGMNWTEVISAVSPAITAKFHSPSVGYCTGFYLTEGVPLKFFRMTDPLDRLLQNDSFASNQSFVVAPNPTTNAVKISGANIHLVQICDLTGKQILVKNYNALNEVFIDMNSWQNGIYLAKIQSTDGTTTSVKIIKE